MGVRHHRHSAAVLGSPRWPALRLQAKRRDGFRCVECGARGRLEVDHVQPVRDAPLLAFNLNNLQTLCASCHARKTAHETGIAPLSPQRRRWRELLKGTCHVGKCEDTAAPV
jgi:5-methylcytosine-specific restriction endonuclease McrA